MSLDKVQFFGAVDRKGKKKDGDIASPFPCWYFPRKEYELEEEIARKRRALKNEMVAPAERMKYRAELEMEEKRLDEIQKAHVKLTGKDKDEANAIYKDFQSQIQDSLFTEMEVKKGLADPHEEARRMKEPIIKADVRYKGVLANMGIVPKGGKISRDEATRCYKIIGKALGENTNVERLRRPGRYDSYQQDVPMQELMRRIDQLEGRK